VTRLRDVVELVRAPAALTVPGDTLAGAASAGWPAGRRTALLPLASTCLYWAGMALNDFADREVDRRERPERPIPSGRVTPRTALGISAGLTAVGLAVATVAGGRRSAGVAAVLAGAVWAYDLSDKSGPVSVATMASTRGLDVLLGASAGGRSGLLRAAVPAALVAAHTAGVTALSRGEVHGSSAGVARACATATAVIGSLAATQPWRGRGAGRRVAATCSGLYAAGVLSAQLSAARTPDATTVRRATGAGIRGLVPLQGALVAGAGQPLLAAALAASAPVGRAAMRAVSPT
jgi:4-hydroxybenzoate polyprenyltransferase